MHDESQTCASCVLISRHFHFILVILHRVISSWVHTVHIFKSPEGASRAFFCAICMGNDSEEVGRNTHVIDNLLANLESLRSLEWCLPCRPSGLLSDDWKLSNLREGLEVINRACPSLEHLGLLNFYDQEISSAIIVNQISSTGGDFVWGKDNVFTGLFPHLRNVTFYIAEERNQHKIVSAAALGWTLYIDRGIRSRISPWCQETTSQNLIIEDINYIMRLYALAHTGNDLEEFISFWGQCILSDVTFEVCIARDNVSQLELLNLLTGHAKSINLGLKLRGLPFNLPNSIRLPSQTKYLGVRTSWCPMSSISTLISPLDLRSLKVEFDWVLYDETDEMVTMALSRDHPTQQFKTEWASESIMACNVAIWGDMIGSGYGENLFEPVVGRAITRTTWESRTHLEFATKALFEDDPNLRRVEIIASHSLFNKEFNSPQLFKI